MTDARQSPDLEAALLDRAKRLAAEYEARGRDSREAILKEQRQHLHSREARISEEAAASADRLYRRREQAAQLRLQADMDRQRWAHIESVMQAIPERLAALSEDREAYEKLLQSLLAQAVRSIGDDEVVAAFNERDLGWLRDRWDAFCAQATPGRTVRLHPEPWACSGGVCVSSRDNRVRVDATFEGRMERYREDLIHVIAERLFAHDVNHLS